MQDCRTTRSLPRPDWRAAPWGRPWRARGADWWRRSQRESGMSISHVDDGQLHAYLDGVRPQAEAWRLGARLGECPACRGGLEEQRALIARAGELLALAAPPARAIPPFPSRPGDAQPPPPGRWPARLPLAWAATVVLALAAGWYLRGEPPIAPAAPDRRAAAANAAAPRDTARTVPTRQAPESKTLAQQAPPASRALPEADEAARSVAAAQRGQMISGSAVPNPQITPLDQAARAKPPPAPAAALAAPAAPLAVRWETIPWDTARVMLGVEPARIPNLPAVAKRRSAAERVVLVEQQLASGTVVRLHERPAAEGPTEASESGAVGNAAASKAAARERMEVGGVAVQRVDVSERLARYVGNLRVEIEGALPADSLSKLLELVK